jgi:hypothetical protein
MITDNQTHDSTLSERTCLLINGIRIAVEFNGRQQTCTPALERANARELTDDLTVAK